MNADIVWFACLALENELLDQEQCLELLVEQGEDVELTDFAEATFEKGWITDGDILQQMVEIAWTKSQEGEAPPYNPFSMKVAPSAPQTSESPAEPEPEEAPPPAPPRKDSSPSLPQPEPENNEDPFADLLEPPKFEGSFEDEHSAPPFWPKKQPGEAESEPSASKPESSSIPQSSISSASGSKINQVPQSSIQPEAPAKPATPAPEKEPPKPDPFAEFDSTEPEAPAQPKAPTPPPAPAKTPAPPLPSGGGEIEDIDPEQIPAALPPFDKIDTLHDDDVRKAMAGLLRYCREQEASDLHLNAGSPAFMRRRKEIQFLSENPLDNETARRLNLALLNENQRKAFASSGDFDLSLALSEHHRYRVNLLNHREGIGGTYRVVPHEIRSLKDLGFGEHVETIEKMLAYHNGLILVTGPVGAGKTATLAALVDYLNEERSDHIIAVESPIEVIQRSKNCNVTQREAGVHTQSFRSALKGALRQDPDIIVIGEMRDLETIEMAISASETGHLVIATMHTSDASTTLNRLVDVFPPAQQSQIRAMVAESLRGIICQRLLPGNKGKLVLACEILLNNIAVGNLIREGKQGLSNIMETGRREGMIQMDASLLKLWEEGKIDDTTARENIQNKMIRKQIG